MSLTTQPIYPTSLEPLIQAWFSRLDSPLGWGTLQERIGIADRCLQLASQQVAGLPLKSQSSIKPQWLTNPAPGQYNNIGDGVFAAAWSMYAAGDAFLWVTDRYKDGTVSTWTVLDPRAVTVKISNTTGLRSYHSGTVEIQADDLIQISRNPRPGTLRGTGALDAYWSVMRSAWASENYIVGVLERGGLQSAVLQKTDGRLREGQAQEVQEQWVQAAQSRLGAPLVLDGEFNFSLLNFSPEQMLLLGIREFDAKAICGAFGVPSVLLNLSGPGGLTYSNVSLLYDLWWRSELSYVAGKISGALSQWLPRGSFCYFDATELLRPEPSANVAMWLSLHQAGIVTADEVRAATLSLPPLVPPDDAAEELLLPSEANTNPSMTEPIQPETVDAV